MLYLGYEGVIEMKHEIVHLRGKCNDIRSKQTLSSGQSLQQLWDEITPNCSETKDKIKS